MRLIRVRVLGPVTVADKDGAERPVERPAVRALLAALVTKLGPGCSYRRLGRLSLAGRAARQSERSAAQPAPSPSPGGSMKPASTERYPETRATLSLSAMRSTSSYSKT